MNRITGRLGWWLIAGTPITVFLVLPVLSLILKAVGNRQLPSAEFGTAISLSLKTSLASIVFIVLLGTPLAFAIGRYRFWGRNILNALIELPVVFPPAAAGLALLLAYGRMGLVPTSFGGTSIAVIMAQTFVACPYYLRAGVSTFSVGDLEAEASASLEGAGPWKVLSHVILPIHGPQLISGAITAWARALGEFGATILFAGNLIGKTQTMPLAVYIGWETDLDQAISLSAVMLGIAFISMVSVRIFSERTKPT